MTAPTPDEGRTERVAALLARHWSYEPTTVYDEWLCECGARIMGGSDGDTDTAMQAHVADQILAVLAAAGPDSTGGQGRSVVEWGVRYEDGEVIRAGRGVIGESFARYSFGRRADPMAARLVLVEPRVPTALMSRLVLVTPDTFGPWQPVEEADQP